MLKKTAVLLAIVSTALGGCTGKLVNGRVEKGIANRLPEIIGPAQSYQVKVSGGPMKIMRGHIPQIEIVGKGVKPGGAYYLDELKIVLTGVRANTDTQTLESVESTVFSAALSEDSLNKYLQKERPQLKELRINLKPDKMMVHTRPGISVVSASVDLSGSLKIESQNKLRYVVDKLSVAGLSTP